MPNLVLLCGPAGAGKSTHARRYAAAGYAVASVDELAWDAGHAPVHPLPDDAARRVAEVLRARVDELLRDGSDVVVDSSFWSLASRDAYRALGAAHGADTLVVYVDTPREVALARVAARAASHPHDVVLAPEVAAAFHDGFEVPTPDEGPLEVVPGT
ncbi:ATP-binding protein [Isoptericola sp. 4D.3]|uniref:ATP-binding protein n=1 Tax=Isoptericola peretonis TaxID=2918523 RepID=A0ABT0J8P8_9MICO|nr:ATP-binding protein [Isoptericola sp. 4D.3]